MVVNKVVQVMVIGGRVLGRSFAAAYKQASAASKYQRAQAKAGKSGGTGRANTAGITLDEACKILDVAPPKAGKADMEEILGRYKRLFDMNDPKKGGSFYLQSKVVRARERLEAEVKPHLEKQAQEAEAKEGWKPKIYKDR